jgi:polyisoprenoid-binding protein YceI
MNKPTAFLIAALLATPAHAAENFTLDPTHTWPMFEVTHLGFTTQRGRFDRTSGKITLDTDARQGSIELSIDTASINMGLPAWDKAMKSSDFFDVSAYPAMRFVSDKLVFDGEKPVSASGKLTLLGVTRPVTLAIHDFKCGTHPMLLKRMCGANISATIKRSDFGMIKFLSMVSDEVHIISPVEAFKDYPPIEGFTD